MRLGWDYPDIVAGDEAAFADPLFDGPHPESGARPNLHRVLVKARDFAGNACEQLWVDLGATAAGVGCHRHAR